MMDIAQLAVLSELKLEDQFEAVYTLKSKQNNLWHIKMKPMKFKAQ